MAALWHAAKVAPFAFTFTFAIALSHAVFLGLPLFLVSANGVDQRRDLRRLGFAVDDAPAGVLTGRRSIPSFMRVRRSMVRRRSSMGSSPPLHG
jgi:hypothetical protein